jgi:hypothetical protein
LLILVVGYCTQYQLKACEADIIDGASQGHKQCRVVKVESENVGDESLASYLLQKPLLNLSNAGMVDRRLN